MLWQVPGVLWQVPGTYWLAPWHLLARPNRFQQRNFSGKASEVQCEQYLHLCELLIGTDAEKISEGKDPLFIASIGHKLIQVRFKGSWSNRLDIPVELRELVNLIHSFISPFLILLPDEDRQPWSMALISSLP